MLEDLLQGTRPLVVTGVMAAAVALALGAWVAALRLRLRSVHQRLREVGAAATARIAALEDDLDAARDEAATAQARVEGWIGEARAAQARLEEAERRFGDRDTMVRECVQAARAAALGSVGALSAQLVEEHRREGERLQRTTEERLRVTSADLMQHMQQVALTVAALDRQVDTTRQRVETVWRALSSPGGAGRLAEVGLENMLRQAGLEAGRDYVLQRPVEGASLRPDAIIFLPGDTALVIDCKASKHLLDLAAAEGGPGETDAYRGLSRTMNRHLRALAHRNYRGEVADGWRRQGREGTPARCVMVMYLPNEGAMEKLARADPAFRDKARALEIAIAGPEALACLMTFAALQVDAVRRADNQERIAAAAQALIDAVGAVLEQLETAGRGLRSAAESHAQLARSVNGRLLPRIDELAGLGIRPTRVRGLRARLPCFDVVDGGGSGIVAAGPGEPAEEGKTEMSIGQVLVGSRNLGKDEHGSIDASGCAPAIASAGGER